MNPHRAQWASLKLVSPLWKHTEEHEKTPGFREVKVKRWGKSTVNLQISEEGRESVPGTEDVIQTVASGDLDWSRWTCPEGTVAHGQPTLEYLLKHSKTLSPRSQLKSGKHKWHNLLALPWVHWNALIISRVLYVTLPMASAHFIFRFAIQQAPDTEKKRAHFCPGIRMLKNSRIYFAIPMCACVCMYVCIDRYIWTSIRGQFHKPSKKLVMVGVWADAWKSLKS